MKVTLPFHLTVCVMLLAGGGALGAVSSSPDYAIPSHVVNAGGGPSASALYGNVSSIGAVTGAASSADYGNTTGFLTPQDPPTATLAPVTDITATSTTLQGTANPSGDATSAYFEYGPTNGYGSTASVTLSPNNDAAAHSVSASLTGLSSGTQYHYRLVAANSGGTIRTADGTFTTLSAAQSWKLTHLGDANAPDLGDPDGDGVSNLLEYALSLNPTAPDSGSLPSAQARTYAEGKRLALIFTRDPSRNDIEIDVQAADSPAGPWTTVASSVDGAAFSGAGFVGEADAGGGLKTVEARDTVNMSNASRRFMRISVTH